MVDSSHYVSDAIAWFALALLLEILCLLQGRYTHIQFILLYYILQHVKKSPEKKVLSNLVNFQRQFNTHTPSHNQAQHQDSPVSSYFLLSVKLKILHKEQKYSQSEHV